MHPNSVIFLEYTCILFNAAQACAIRDKAQTGGVHMVGTMWEVHLFQMVLLLVFHPTFLLMMTLTRDNADGERVKVYTMSSATHLRCYFLNTAKISTTHYHCIRMILIHYRQVDPARV